MEDIINALLDVVRAQHSATEGTDEAPFNMDDIVDMAMNLLGRPDEQSEVDKMVGEIQKTVETLAPDIFPPKSFEEMDDSEKVLSASSMIENAFLRNNTSSNSQASSSNQSQHMTPYEAYEQEEEEEQQDVGDLNDLIYKNFMSMMGLNAPQVEFPFDRSQIVYGKEKSVTEMLADEEEEKNRAIQEDAERNRKLSAWELAQNAIDSDEAAHAKEPYVPKPIEQPKAKSASQMAAEAIRKSEEEDRMKLEIEKQAEAMMAEAKKRGQDPMKFMLHQQEILRYMESNSDELVSFEDYEDLSPEEKMEIELKLHIEKQLADGVDPDEVDTNVPEEYIPMELRQSIPEEVSTAQASTEDASTEETNGEETTFDDDVLKAMYQQVMSENAEMFQGENNEDMAAFQEELFANLKRAMAGSGTPVPTEDVDSLLEQAAENSKAESQAPQEEPQETPQETVKEEAPVRGLSAVELAMAAQKAAKPEPKEEESNKVSAADLAKAAQEQDKNQAANEEESQEEENILDMNFDELDDMFEEDDSEEEVVEEPQTEAPVEDIQEEPAATEDTVEEAIEETEEVTQEAAPLPEEEEEDEYEYVDPDELVLGEHTQAEVDEALDNLSTLGLEGEVYERAKRMILLELAGSEAALEAYFFELENSTKKKKAAVSAIDEDNLDDLSDFDEDLFEKELEMAMDEDFEDEVSEDEQADDDESEEESEEESVEESEDEDDIIPEEETREEVVIEPETEKIIVEEAFEEAVEDVNETPEIKEEVKEKKSKAHRNVKTRKSVVHKKEKAAEKKEETQVEDKAEERGYQVSVRNPFVLKNSTSYIDKFADFITESQENRKLSTGFKKLDGLLRFGLHKGSYFIDAKPQYLKNSFMQQIADRAAESGVDVLYISTELSRYDLMLDTISRLSYEMNGQDSEKAHSVMDIMTGEDGATLESLADELNWFRGRISEHLFILDQEAVDEYIDSMEDLSAGAILEELIRSIVVEGAHKPVVFIDNIENILSVEDSEDMKPLMNGIKQLAKELSIPIIMSYGYAQAENEEELSPKEMEFHESIGNMCDVYLELQYADMITEDYVELTEDDIREMAEDGESLLIDVLIHRNRRPMRASCQIQATPKYNFFEE